MTIVLDHRPPTQSPFVPSAAATQTRRRAFSLLELVAVIVVIGVLSLIAVPAYQANRDRAVEAADRASLATVARAAAALAALDETAVAADHVAAALAECTSCTAAPVPGTTAAPGDPWQLVGHDAGDGPVVDPAVPDASYAATYGYVLGDGWGTPAVHLVMASRIDSRYTHATITDHHIDAWTDGTATTDGTAPAPAPPDPAPDPDPGPSYNPDTTPTVTELAFTGTPGDTAGVFHHLGTNYGTAAWQNPSTAGRLTIQASSYYESPEGDTARHAVDRTGLAYHSLHQANSWIRFDLQAGQTLDVDHYTILGRDWSDHPRNWQLQGSNDATTWTTLRAHTNDTGIDRNVWGSFPVTDGPAGYRHFRILNTGLNSTNSHWLIFAEIELYGTLTRTPPAAFAGATERLSFTSPGDTNGLFHWAGTRYGTEPWQNPAAAGTVFSAASSEHSTSNRPWAATDRTGGVYHSVHSPGQWVRWDLGPRVRIRPNAYSILGRDWSDHPRNWVLEGSHDGTTWTVLHTHAADISVHRNRWASWNLTTSDAYRHLRVRNTGTNSTGSDWLIFNEIEFYGDVILAPESPVPAGANRLRVSTLGDTGGLIHRIGTAAGTRSFTNPSANGDITAVSSSTYQANWAGHGAHLTTGRTGATFHSEHVAGSWISWDLGHSTRIAPHFYSIRGRNGSDHPRNFVLEGSADGTTWTVLRAHSNDTSVQQAGWAGWYVEGAAAHRYLRIRNTGVNSTGAHWLILDEIEFYGDVFHTPRSPLPGATVLDFDGTFGGTGGLVWHIGTNGGTTTFAPPGMSGGPITATASSVYNSSTTPGHGIDRSPGSVFHSNHVAGSWAAWDLGPSRALRPTYYTIRGRDYSDHVRNWVLEGSHDGTAWTVLHTHAADPRVDYGTWGGWHVTTDTAYRHLRVRNTGVNSTNSHWLIFSEIEFYGDLTG